MSLFHDPAWPRASEWLANSPSDGPLLAIGDLGANVSITPGRTDEAPRAIRDALARLSTFDLETGLDLSGTQVWDAGDLDPHSQGPIEGLEGIAMRWADALEGTIAGVILGGDNSVTRPAVHALARHRDIKLEEIGIVTLDAHLDLRTTQGGLHNGNVIAALLEDGLPGQNVYHIGIAPFANSREYVEASRQAGTTIVSLEEVRKMGVGEAVRSALADLKSRVKAIQLDLDVDVLDRAFAPACPGARPGGLTVGEVREGVQAAAAEPLVASVSIMEIDPSLDSGSRTVIAAAQFLCTFATGIQRR